MNRLLCHFVPRNDKMSDVDDRSLWTGMLSHHYIHDITPYATILYLNKSKKLYI